MNCLPSSSVRKARRTWGQAWTPWGAQFFGDEEIDDGAYQELRERINEISTGIEALEHL